MKLTPALVSLVATGAIAAAIALGRRAPDPPACDLDTGPCEKTLADGTRVVFEVTPRPVRSMARLDLAVRVTRAGQPVDGLLTSASFEMPDMFMGSNRVGLSGRGAGLYAGQGTLVRCPSGGKTWRARLRFAPDAGAPAATDFGFLVDQP